MSPIKPALLTQSVREKAPSEQHKPITPRSSYGLAGTPIYDTMTGSTMTAISPWQSPPVAVSQGSWDTTSPFASRTKALPRLPNTPQKALTCAPPTSRKVRRSVPHKALPRTPQGGEADAEACPEEAQVSHEPNREATHVHGPSCYQLALSLITRKLEKVESKKNSPVIWT